VAEPRRLIIGISGASGAIYGVRMLEVLKGMPEVETHLVITPAARQTIALETDWRVADVRALADVTYRPNDVAAAIASGSRPIDAMAVVPCSVRTLGAIAWSGNDSLLVRAADVTLKERRVLVIALRETPLHLGHLRAMTQVTEMGGIIAPLMPAFYGRPATLDDVIDHTVGRLLDLLGIKPPETLVRRWAGAARPPA
jgi:4-hydroxy-3-polyprenylbenzoate decarboxylase